MKPQRVQARRRLPASRSVLVHATPAGQRLADIATVIEAVPRPAEDDDAPVDRQFLVRQAAVTGGRVIDPSVADGWLPVAPSSFTVVKQQSYDLWHNFALVLLLCDLLAADWSLRLFRGYV